MTDILDALFLYLEETQLKAYLDADPQYRSAVLKIEHWEESLTGRRPPKRAVGERPL